MGNMQISKFTEMLSVKRGSCFDSIFLKNLERLSSTMKLDNLIFCMFQLFIKKYLIL